MYQRLSKDLSLQQITESFALNLAALLCRKRLLPLDRKDKKRIIEVSFMIDLNTVIDSQNINNKRTIFEQMIMSLMRVLIAIQNSENIFHFLAKFLDKIISLLKSLDDVANQYCVRKLRERMHNEAFNEVKKELLTCVQTMLNE